MKGCEEKSVNVDFIEYCHKVCSFSTETTGILIEGTPGKFFLKALADCSREALLLFEKDKL